MSDINSADFLTPDNILLVVESSYLGCVQCNFDSKNAEVISNIKKGQEVIITGKCEGLSTFNVMISDCKFQ